MKKPEQKKQAVAKKKLKNPIAPPSLRSSAFTDEEFLALPVSKKGVEISGTSPRDYLLMIKTLSAMFPTQFFQDIAKRSLLSMEAGGWEKIESWDDLFVLYKRGDEYVAELSDKLVAIDTRHLKGNTSKGYEEIAKLQRAIFCIQIRSQVGKPLLEIDSTILNDLTGTIGDMMNDAWFDQSEGASLNKAEELKNLFSKAIDGMMRLKYPSKKVRSAGSTIAKERVAIAFAKELCGAMRRLPTKAEVRSFMEQEGHGYVDERGRATSKWSELFTRSGLGALKD
jgi:hypothetical protein